MSVRQSSTLRQHVVPLGKLACFPRHIYSNGVLLNPVNVTQVHVDERHRQSLVRNGNLDIRADLEKSDLVLYALAELGLDRWQRIVIPFTRDVLGTKGC